MPLIFKDDALLFVDGALALHEDCCCEDADPKVCGDCDMNSTSQFEVDIPGLGTFTLTNGVYVAGVNCSWERGGVSGSVCGDVENVTLQYSSTNGGWTLSIQLLNGPGSGTWRSATNTQLLGCGPWSMVCPKFFGSFNACALTTPASYTATVTLIP